jgi:hypothetical protein
VAIPQRGSILLVGLVGGAVGIAMSVSGAAIALYLQASDSLIL